MDDQMLIRRLKLNYSVLAKLYKQGKFEEEVYAADQVDSTAEFYFVGANELENKVFFRQKNDDSARGIGRHPHDLQWATANLREQAHYLFEKYSNGGAGVIADEKTRENVIARIAKVMWDYYSTKTLNARRTSSKKN